MPKPTTRLLLSATRAAAIAALLGLATPASPDSIKIGELPQVDGVVIIGVQDGKLTYRTSVGGERSEELSKVNYLALDAVPAFATGLDAFNQGQMRSAQRAFEGVWQDSRVDWVRHYAGYYLAQVYDARNEPVSAGQVYAKLAAEGADLFFLAKPPVKSLVDADADQKKRLTAEILAVIKNAKGEQRKQLETYLKQVAGDAVEIPQDQPVGPANPADKLKAQSKVILPEAVWKMLDRQGERADKWLGITLLSEGKYAETIEAMQPWLNNAGDLPEKLFIVGRAQLALADAETDTQKKDQLYRDAGLTFMRIVVHFDRKGKPHELVAPARLEVAYIHKQIGRGDIFDKIILGEKGSGGIGLMLKDAEAYPQYRKRYYAVIGEPVPAE